MYEGGCFLLNYTFTRVRGMTLQSNKYHCPVVEFLNNNFLQKSVKRNNNLIVEV